MITPISRLHYRTINIEIYKTFGYQFVFKYKGYVYTAFFDTEENCKTNSVAAVNKVLRDDYMQKENKEKP